MGRNRMEENAEIIARSGGPPTPLPANLNDFGPIFARWPLMLKYDPPTGELWWRYVVETHPNPQYLDRGEYLATYTTTQGNKRVNTVRIDGFAIPAARVVWLLHHRAWPPSALLRRDGDSLNDRIENLIPRTEAPPNIKRGRERSRPIGVARRYDRWQAYVRFPGGVQKTLGVFKTEAEAVAARARWDEAQAAEAVGDLV
jgi:hypothetical protein